MKKKNITKVLLSSILITSIISGTILLTNTNNKEDSSLIISEHSEKGIKILSIKHYASNAKYGNQVIHFSIGPKIHDDELLYKIEYVDGTIVEDDIFNINIDMKTFRVIVECNKPFTKQVIFTLYSMKNNEVSASATIDFKEKILTEPSIDVINDSPLVFNPNITTTGGSITIDKELSDVTITFNQDFVNNVKTLLLNRYLSKEFSNPQTTTYERISESYVGLTNNDCKLLFSNNFTYDSFAEGIYLKATYTWIESDSDYETTENVTYSLADLAKEDFNLLFDGNTTIFEVTYYINKLKYTYSSGLKISDIPIKEITITNGSIVF